MFFVIADIVVVVAFMVFIFVFVVVVVVSHRIIMISPSSVISHGASLSTAPTSSDLRFTVYGFGFRV